MKMSKNDTFGAGGNRDRGWRTIQKGGIIKWDGCVFQDDSLLNVVGERVEVSFEGKGIWVDGPIRVHFIVGGSLLIEKSERQKLAEARQAALDDALKFYGIQNS